MYLLSIAAAFLGYVLPWGQMSFWGASVITNLIAAIPVVGKKLVFWVWGGFNVGSPTLTFFFSLHYITPLVITLLRVTHLVFLHEDGSSTPIKMHIGHGNLGFSPYYVYKDLLNFVFVLLFFGLVTLSVP
jgi:ubiquinol-cytochrome c reductase cytochrome b subunit